MLGERTESAGRAEGRRAGGALEDRAPVRSHSEMLIVILLFHRETSLIFLMLSFSRLSTAILGTGLMCAPLSLGAIRTGVTEAFSSMRQP
jgi:hypothetical protein